MTTLEKKYKPVLELVNDLAVNESRVWQEDGKLHIQAVVRKPEQRETIADLIAEISGDMPADLVARIDAENQADNQVEN